MRHNANPQVFMVVAINMMTTEEHVLELIEQDIYQLLEGKQGLMIDGDDPKIQTLILDNLILIENLDGHKMLSCGQKIFFNPIW
jgi:hypothetical protein